MKRILQMVLFFSMTVFVFDSCKKEKSVNETPVANAGPDQMLILPLDSTELRGSGIDADGSIVSYEWKKISGPVQYTFQNTMDAITKIRNLVKAVYIFELTVTDNSGSSGRDRVVVTVLDGPFDPCYGCWDY